MNWIDKFQDLVCKRIGLDTHFIFEEEYDKIFKAKTVVEVTNMLDEIMNESIGIDFKLSWGSINELLFNSLIGFEPKNWEEAIFIKKITPKRYERILVKKAKQTSQYKEFISKLYDFEIENLNQLLLCTREGLGNLGLGLLEIEEKSLFTN